MKKLITFATAILFAMTSSTQSETSEINSEKEADAQTLVFLDEFFQKIIFSRDIRFFADYFASESEYLSLNNTLNNPDSKRIDNYGVDISIFQSDCNQIMNLLPKIDTKTFTRVQLKKIAEPVDPEKIGDGVQYKVKYSYGFSSDKFEFITPTICKFKGKPKFVSRFWVPFRHSM